MQHPDGMQKLARAALIVTSALVIFAGTVWAVRFYAVSHQQATVQAANSSSSAIGGFPMPGKPAPDFQLTDQFNHPVSLASLKGREVVMAFVDPRCTTLCPLTAQIMYDARAKLTTSEAKRVVLVAINANPAATSITEIQAWSIKHGLLHQWLFLTGTPKQLQSIYKAYDIYVQVDSTGQSVHDPATFIIDPQGRAQLYFETLDSKNQTDLLNQEIGLEDGMQQWLSKSTSNT